ncbi:MAG TPA: glycosyltransferase family 9 protein [Oxalicibacterium sp.]|nr:glycosyltransferase family 9 protein [Oxalicibacterium sp.]
MDGNFQEATAAPLLLQPDVRKIAVFRALQLGDMLCAVPALRALRTALPHAHITLIGLPWAAQFAQRFRGYIDDFRAFPGHPSFPEQPVQQDALPDFYRAMRAARYDLALQLHGSGDISNGVVEDFGARRTAGYATAGSARCDAHSYFPYPDGGPEPLRLLGLMRLLGAPQAGTHLEFPLHEEDWDELKCSGLAAGLVAGNYFCVHPGARFRDKCWPPQRFAEIAEALARQFGLQAVLTGSAKESDLTQAVAAHMQSPAVDTASPLSIGAMAALMSGARLMICNDTGVSHIAAGLRLRSVVIFNKADMVRWGPLDHRLHRCIWDPRGERADDVLRQAQALLSADA